MKAWKDLGLRFFLGGFAVAACYIVLQLIPWKSFAGIFAAFPAVMAASIIMAGVFEDSKQASDVALGATAGMMGCAVCVLTAYYCLIYYHNWLLAIGLSLLTWVISSAVFITLIQSLKKKSTGV